MNLYFFTGAGISKESGIPTYRDAVDGLWYNHRIEDVATAEALRRQPQVVFDFFNDMRKKLDEYKPNEAHILIAQAQLRHSVTVVTQNVDDLHERAGSTNVVHLHGNLRQMRSSPKMFRGRPLYLPYDRDIKVGDVAEDGTQLRPHVVLFGEQVPNMGQAIKDVDWADALIIVGTTLEIHPAASLVDYFLHDGKPVYYVDPQPNLDYGNRITYITKKATEGVADLIALLEKK